MDTENAYNVVVLGNVHVGKSSIIERRLRGTFDENTTPTIGVNHLAIKESVNGKDVVLNLWDTAGQEDYNSIVPIYFRNSHVCIFVADVTSRDSFRDLDKWKKLLVDNNEEARQILAINKIDLMPDIPQAINEASDNNDQMFVESNDFLNEIRNIIKDYPNRVWVSALNGTGVNDLFTMAAQLSLDFNLQAKNNKLDEDTNNKKDCC